MLHSYIASQIYDNFRFEPTSEQKILIDSLARYITEGDQGSLFMTIGYAGVGKTTVVGALVRALGAMNIKVVLLAPTGRAAKVMSQYADGARAYTIHRRIYRQKRMGAGVFSLNINKDNHAVYIVDEASMHSNGGGNAGPSGGGAVFGTGRLLDDLLEYVFMGEHNRLIFVGDNAQLPPVGMELSPALDASFMKRYVSGVESVTLRQVMRQAQESGILYNATKIRELIETQDVQEPRIDLGFKDVRSIGGADLIEQIEDCYWKYGRHETLFITRSNKRANLYNNGIRNTVLDYQEEISKDDLLMVVKNNYFYAEQQQIERAKLRKEQRAAMGEAAVLPDAAAGAAEPELDFIANGDTAVVDRIYRFKEIYGFRFAYVSLRFEDYNDMEMECWVMLDTLTSEAPSLTQQQSQAFFNAIEEDYAEIPNKQTRYAKIMQNEFYNALQVKFAYAVTCHKAQGGQWAAVFIDTLLFGDQQISLEYLRWLYTAFTRASERVYLVNWNERFFVEEHVE